METDLAANTALSPVVHFRKLFIYFALILHQSTNPLVFTVVLPEGLLLAVTHVYSFSLTYTQLGGW